MSGVDDLTGGLGEEDLPWIIDHALPTGFLGRLIAHEMGPSRLPRRPEPMAAQRTSFATSAGGGWDAPGNLVLGERAFTQYLRAASSLEEAVLSKHELATDYALQADDALRGHLGSSAGGEQPKFLAWREPGPTAVLVKFSPPREAGAAALRSADLLVAEHLALRAINQAHLPAARSRILDANGRFFLEVERFDRTESFGRRGVISLRCLDDQFLGSRAPEWPAWPGIVEGLIAAGIVSTQTLPIVRWLHLFGRLIGNSDMHRDNLSFFLRGGTVQDLCLPST